LIGRRALALGLQKDCIAIFHPQTRENYDIYLTNGLLFDTMKAP
jgi:hypothetical protein